MTVTRTVELAATAVETPVDANTMIVTPPAVGRAIADQPTHSNPRVRIQPPRTPLHGTLLALAAVTLAVAAAIYVHPDLPAPAAATIADPGPSCTAAGIAMTPAGNRPPTTVALAGPNQVTAAGHARWCRSVNPTIDAVILVIDLDPAAVAASDLHLRLHDQACLALFVPTDGTGTGRTWRIDTSHPGPYASPPLHIGRGFALAVPCDYTIYLRVAGGTNDTASI